MSSYGMDILERDQCFELLGARGLGRVGCTIGGRPVILPVNYAMLGEDVVFRTDPGTKLTAAVLATKVAFEVDGAEPFSHDGWSVLIIGHAEEVLDQETRDEVSRLPLRPWVDGARDSVVRIRTEEITGRRIAHHD